MIDFLTLLAILAVYLLASAPVLYMAERIRVRDYKACERCQSGYRPVYSEPHMHATALFGVWGALMAFWPLAVVYFLCRGFVDWIIKQANKEKPVVLVRKPSRFARIFRTED